ncbi:MFS transporter [Curtobacterium pusillum]|uniref:MFS transporter n=1 Tax=Curtobacterium pusillum TaxID=69373 RepID=UPI0016439CDA|nr:MFS transporter [Curtobacterium pusillum]
MIGSTTVPKRARRAVFLAFFLNGFALALWVVNVPAVAASADVGNAVLGTTLLALGAGSLLAMQASGYLSALLGSRVSVMTGAVLLAVGLLLIAEAGSAWGLSGALFVFGMGNGCIDVAMNDQAVVVERRYGRPIMAAFHALFSVGGAVGAGLGALVQSVGIRFEASLTWTAGLVVVLGVVAVLGLLGRRDAQAAPERDDTEAEATAAPRGPILRRALVLGVLAFAFMLAEGMVNDWSALHARQHLGESAASASLAYFFFAVTMTAGRLVVDRVAATVGPTRVVRWGSVVAVAGLVVVVTSPLYPVTIVGWVLFGAGVAGIVPQIFTAAGALAPGRRGSIVLSRVVSGGYVGMLAGPAVIGWLSAGVGINTALVLPLVLLVVGVVAAPVVGATTDVAPARRTPGASEPAGTDEHEAPETRAAR